MNAPSNIDRDPRSSDWMAGWLLRLCACDTTSGREDAGLPELRALLAELGAEVELQEAAPGRHNVLATWGEPRLLFSTHLDTVPPYILPWRLDDVIHGRGACDAKGQALAQLGAIRALLAEGRRGFAWLGVVGEEKDSAGANAALALKDCFRNCRALVNGEPTELKLASGQRGLQHLRLSCEGRAAHSGSPELGRSAAWPLLDWLEALRRVPRPLDPELGPEVWNLGLLRAGAAPNVIPAEAEAELLARTLPDSDFAARVRELQPEGGRTELLLEEPPDRYPALPGFEQAPMPFGSDAPLLRQLIPDRCVVLAGPGSITLAHTAEERISLAELEAGLDLNLRLAHHFLKDPS